MNPVVEKPRLAASPVLDLIAASELTLQPVRWVWPGWLASGKLHLLAGAAGTGKTTIALDVIAGVTVGRPLPDGFIPAQGRAVVWSGEDDAADTLLPRLIAAGADLDRVQFVRGVREHQQRYAFDPAQDLPLLAQALRQGTPPTIILIDPIVSAIASDSHKNAEVRRSLAPLVELAAELGAALIGITHYSKGTAGRDPLARVTGSLAFGALARIVWGTVRQAPAPGDERRMTLARAKSNLGEDGGGFAYSFELVELAPDVQTSRIHWGEALKGSAQTLLAEPGQSAAGDENGARDDAAAFLRSLLADGPVRTKTLRKEAEGAGHAWGTMLRAKAQLGVQARKQGGTFGGEGAAWFWALPQEVQDCSMEHLGRDAHKMRTTPQDTHSQTVSTLCEVEHLVQPCAARLLIALSDSGEAVAAESEVL